MFAVLTRDPVGRVPGRVDVAPVPTKVSATSEQQRVARGVSAVQPVREKLTVDARPCRDNGMDFCLDVTGSSRGVKRYYSKKGWEIGRLEDALPTVEAAVSAFEADQDRVLVVAADAPGRRGAGRRAAG